MRKFYSAKVPCNAGCQYCFAKWHEIYKEMSQIDSEIISDKESIIYPCCDGEFFEQQHLIDAVKKIASEMNRVYVSVSTKKHFTDENISTLAQLHCNLVQQKKGFVKLGISLSSKSMLSEIEPKTMSYSERLETARRIAAAGIPIGLTIKPVLPFITAEEYCDIIEDFSKYTKRVLVGGLYVNKQSSFYSKYLPQYSNKYIQKRTVEWLAARPAWDYIEDAEQMATIHQFCKKRKIDIFDSDIDLIRSIISDFD